MAFYGGGDNPLKVVKKGQLTQPGGTSLAKAASCDKEAKARGLSPMTPEYETFYNTCMAGGGGEQSLTKAAQCDRSLKARGLSPMTPEYEAAYQECMGIGGGGGGGGCGKGKVTSGGYPNGRDWPGCPCSAAYYPNEGEGCQAGYSAVGSGADARCECDKYDAEVGSEDGGGGNKLGEFNWPSEMQDYYGALIGRGRDLLARKPGYGESIMNMMLGQATDIARGGENLKRQTMTGNLAAEGLLGTGAGLEALQTIPRESESAIAEAARQIQFQNEAQKRTDIEKWSTLANTLFGSGMGYNQIREAINAGRRGEGQTAMALWLQYLQSLMSGYKSA